MTGRPSNLDWAVVRAWSSDADRPTEGGFNAVRVRLEFEGRSAERPSAQGLRHASCGHRRRACAQRHSHSYVLALVRRGGHQVADTVSGVRWQPGRQPETIMRYAPSEEAPVWRRRYVVLP